MVFKENRNSCMKQCIFLRKTTWGIMERRRRRSSRPIFAMSIPSMSILPLHALFSTSRNIAAARLDFPDPVLPKRPTFSWAIICLSNQFNESTIQLPIGKCKGLMSSTYQELCTIRDQREYINNKQPRLSI